MVAFVLVSSSFPSEEVPLPATYSVTGELTNEKEDQNICIAFPFAMDLVKVASHQVAHSLVVLFKSRYWGERVMLSISAPLCTSSTLCPLQSMQCIVIKNENSSEHRQYPGFWDKAGNDSVSLRTRGPDE